MRLDKENKHSKKGHIEIAIKIQKFKKDKLDNEKRLKDIHKIWLLNLKQT
jgi:hypothetical protein